MIASSYFRLSSAAEKLRLAVPPLVLMAAASGQTFEHLQAPPAPNLLQNLSIDPARRSALQSVIEKHDYAAAEDLLAEEARRDPKSQSILLALANILFLDGKQLNSALVLKKAERLAPLDERHRFLLALSYVAINRPNLARPELEQLAQSSPSNANYPYWLARIAYRKMDIRACIAYAQKAIQLDPAFMKAYDQLGLCYGAADNTGEAIKAFQQAIRLNERLPVRSPWPSMNLGILLLRLERLDEAEAHLRNAIAISPRFPAAHYRLAQVHEKNQRYEDAAAELREAVSLDPSYPEPHYALARIQRKRGNINAAESELKLFQNLRKADKLRGITRPD